MGLEHLALRLAHALRPPLSTIRAALKPLPAEWGENGGEASISGEMGEAPGPKRLAGKIGAASPGLKCRMGNGVKPRSAARGAKGPWTRASSGKKGTRASSGKKGTQASSGNYGGERGIRTPVGRSQQIYSLPPLATRAPHREESRGRFDETMEPMTELESVTSSLPRKCSTN